MTQAGGHVASFDEFIRGCLLSQGVVTGVSVITRQGDVVFNYGELQKLTESEIQQFQKVFSTSHGTPQQLGYFTVKLASGEIITYKVYQKTFTGVYATSDKGSGGLMVCNLPYGVMVSVYDQNTRTGEAIKAVEHFCDLMRK